MIARAFTLIELVVVVVILAIVGAIALPARSGAVLDYRIRLVESRLQNDLMQLQRWSWHTARKTSLAVSVVDDEYTLTWSETPLESKKVALNESPYHMTIDQVDFGDGINGVTFADGIPLKGAKGTFLSTLSNNQFTVTLESDDVKVTIEPR